MADPLSPSRAAAAALEAVPISRTPPPTRPPVLAGELPAEAVAEWAEEGPTGMDQPAYATTRALLIEIRRQTAATALVSRAVGRLTLVAGFGMLLLLGAVLVVAAALLG